jgi:hypothetical protein
MKRILIAACFLGCVWAGCSGSSSGGGNCSGEAPAGATCHKPAGGCEAMVCEGSTWGCPAQDTQIALTAANCTGPCSGNVVPAGSTCLTPSGGCEAMECQGSAWGCPGSDRQIALTASNCPNGVAGADAGQD